MYSGVVLYDAGSKSGEALTFGFEREDFEVFATETASEALTLLEMSKAPVLAVSIGTDPDAREEALAFIGSLRDRGSKRALAVVVLGRRELREDALRAGADEFVAWPAFIRDAVTLARLAIAARPDGGGIAGLLEDYEVYFLVRALAAAGRSAVVELERGGHKGQLHFARGELVAARAGRLSGVVAFHHLLLWGEAQLKLRFSSPPGERKIHAPIDELLQSGLRFVDEFEKLAARVGGPQATFEKRPDKFADAALKVPPEVMRFAEALVSGATLVDIVESSPFKPFDTIKVCYRLCELGLVARRDPVRAISPLTAQLAVRDWLLGTAAPEARSTVTEAGRRAAEAYADEAARRSDAINEPGESDDLFGDRTVRVEKLDAEALGLDHTAHAEAAQPEASDSALATTMVAALPAATVTDLATPFPSEQSFETFADITTDTEHTALQPPSEPKVVVEAQHEEEVAAALTPVIERPKAAAAQIVPASALPKHELPEADAPHTFDELDEAFFAKEEELQRVDPVETFDDLDASGRVPKVAPKKKWSLFGGSKPSPVAKPVPAKPEPARAASAKTQPQKPRKKR
ncbi:MAG: DUF4388 domain-containing protein [Polyangia bacterium]